MSNNRKWTGASMAAALALAFIAVPYPTALAKGSDIVICPGVNACKGKTDCKMTTDSCRAINECKGQNACKGKGFLMLSKAECVKRGSYGIKRSIPANAVGSLPVEDSTSDE